MGWSLGNHRRPNSPSPFLPALPVVRQQGRERARSFRSPKSIGPAEGRNIAPGADDARTSGEAVCLGNGRISITESDGGRLLEADVGYVPLLTSVQRIPPHIPADEFPAKARGS